MSDTIASLSRTIAGAKSLHSVVRTMKALAASNIVQYENSVRSLADYLHAVEMGLHVCFRNTDDAAPAVRRKKDPAKTMIGAIVFGSDQGLVGQFNDVVAAEAVQFLAALPGKTTVWAIGERIHGCLADAGLVPEGLFTVPNSVKAIAKLVGQIQLETELHQKGGAFQEVYVFHNRPQSGTLYDPVRLRLLPLDEAWRRSVAVQSWPARQVPEVIAGSETTLAALVREYLFISLFQACAESLASENATRLAAMQRADKNIDEMLGDLNGAFRRLRQSGIDEELFDVIAGFEALTKGAGTTGKASSHSRLEQG